MHRRPTAAVLAVAAVALAGCAHSATPSALSKPTVTPGAASASVKAGTPAAPTTCALTGQPATAAAIARPAVAVKIDNVAPARPQSGLNNADIVVEEQVEGGLTRLFAVFACSNADKIGPIRSARTTDADLLALLHGSVFAFSGANPKVLPPIEARGNAVLLVNDNAPQWFYRSSARPMPHNVYSSSATLLKGGLAARPRLSAPAAWFSYGALDPAARPATKVRMSWPAASAGWTWAGTGWVRTQDGSADTLTSGSRVSATNVVVLAVRLTSTGIRDVAGNASPDDVVTGSGALWVFRNGHVVTGRWTRGATSAPWRFTDAAGHPITLAPGRTWVELEAQPSTLRIS